MEDQRALVEMLLGKDRNLSKDDAPHREEHWSDSDVCPYYLCGFCPHDLFVNTKSDLGPCPFTKHSVLLQENFSKESDRHRRSVEKEFLNYLRELARECDRKIARGKKRVELMAETANLPIPMPNAQLEKRKQDYALRREQLTNEMNGIKEKMEELGEQGRMEDVEAMLSALEPLEQELKQLDQNEKELENGTVYAYHPNANGNGDYNNNRNKFDVCLICGVFQATDDADERKQRHMEGKQHNGMAQIRDKIRELEQHLFGESFFHNLKS